MAVPNDAQKTNFTVKDLLTAGRIWTQEFTVNDITANNITANDIKVNTLDANDVETKQAEITVGGSGTNVVWTPTPNAVFSGYIPVFNTNGQTSVTPMPNISNITLASFFGTGSDGNVTISVPTSLTQDMFYDTLTIQSTLTPQGNIIYCKTACIIEAGGLIVANGSNGLAGTNGTRVGAAGSPSVGVLPAGQNGTNGTINNGQTVTLALETNFGGAGGTGGTGTLTTGGINNITQQRWINKNSIISNPWFFALLQYNNAGALGGVPGLGGGGGGGTAAGSHGGGAGGGGGGWIMILTPQLTVPNSVVFEAMGGNGGIGQAPNPTGGGGGGGGGVVYIISVLSNATSANADISGGTGGVAGGLGTNGGNGNAGVFKQLML